MDKFIVSLPKNNKRTNMGFSLNKKRTIDENANASKDIFVPEQKKRKFGALSAKAVPPLKQSFLDMGQKSFGATSSCAKCGMFYLLGDADDEVRHRAFCRAAGVAKSLTSLKGFHVLDANIEACSNTSAKIVEVRWAERRKLLQEPLRSILDDVQSDLGSSLSIMEESSDESVILYLHGLKVVGCIVRETVSMDQLVRLTSERGTADVDIRHFHSVKSASPAMQQAEKKNLLLKNVNSSQSYSISANSECEPNARSPGEMEKASLAETNGALEHANATSGPGKCRKTLGIKLIWVHANHRHNGIASRLLDTARRTFEFGMIVKREDVAYSQPTQAGLGLFLAYSNQKSIFGYC